MNPDLDLQIERIIQAPVADVWAAWTDPEQLAQWFIPEPMECRVDRLELTPGGAFVTSMRVPGGETMPHIDGCILAAVPHQRLVYTIAIDSSWRPRAVDHLRMTAELTFAEHSEGTRFRAVISHADESDRAHHEELGFAAGWTTVIDQLAALLARQHAR